MKPKHLFCSLLLAMLVASSMSLRTVKADLTVISVSPVTTTVTVGNTFTVDINLNYAQNLYGFEIWLSFDRIKLNANSINYANYLNEPTLVYDQQVNNALGYVSMAVSSLFPALPITGGSPPPLVKVNFTAISTGSSTLHLYNTLLVNSTAQPIPHATTDGAVQIVSGVTHDVAVTDVIPNKSVVGQGYGCNITVATENHGGFTETFNVTAYANTTIIASQAVTLTSGNFTTLTFTWNTSGFAKGNYTLSAYAWPVPGETDTADNNFTGGWVRVSMVGDLCGTGNAWDFVPDGVVDGSDLSIVAKCYGSWPGAQPPMIWNANCDVNNDGVVDGSDLAIVAKHFGEGGP